MRKKKIFVGLILLVLLGAINVVIFNHSEPASGKIDFTMTVSSSQSFATTVYYISGNENYHKDFSQIQSRTVTYGANGVNTEEKILFQIPNDVTYIRLDPGDTKEKIEVSDISFKYRRYKKIKDVEFDLTKAIQKNNISSIKKTSGNSFLIKTENGDPYIVMPLDNNSVAESIKNLDKPLNNLKHLILCLMIDCLVIIVWIKWDSLISFPKDIIGNRKMLKSLAKNDFKSRFSGSYLGIVWAFVNPIVTVILYWFVFQKALNAGTQSTKSGIAVPYVLWLLAGLVPWFYFSDAWSSGTNALVEYSYLVKKVVFKVKILPVVKVFSSVFVHIFFIGFTIVMYIMYGYYPKLFNLQIIYYSIAMMIFTLGLVYICAAIVPFFRDLSQIIAIFMQVLMWMTPIMWNIDAMNINPIVEDILKLNPMYYIISGYRDSLISGIYFWDKFDLTLYFWIFTGFMVLIGTTIFKKLEVHFADVL
jgi:teichoic acid transport system permease protein